MKVGDIIGLSLLLMFVLGIRSCVSCLEENKKQVDLDAPIDAQAAVMKAEESKKAEKKEKEKEIKEQILVARLLEDERKKKDDIAKKEKRIELVKELEELRADSNADIRNMEIECQSKVNALIQEIRDLDCEITIMQSRTIGTLLGKNQAKVMQRMKTILIKRDELQEKIAKLRSDLQRDIDFKRAETKSKEQALIDKISALGLFPPFFIY